MQIALIFRHLNQKGGLEKYGLHLRRYLEERGYSVAAITAQSFFLPKMRFQRLAAFDKACGRFVKKYPFDVVFGLEKTSFQTHLRLGEGVHAAFLHEREKQSSWLRSYCVKYSPFHRRMLEIEQTAITSPQLQKLFCNSEMVKNQVLSYYDINPEKIFVVRNGVEWQEFHSPFNNWPENKTAALKKYRLPDTFHFLFVGHGFERKGLKLLLHAFARLPTEAHLSIVGDDKNRKAFIQLAYALDLQNRVRFFGSRHNLAADFYSYADCVVICSLYDPFANVTLEALAMGVPVISSTHNGGHEILPKRCWIEDIYQVDAICHALTTAMKYPKSVQSATKLRQEVKDYDFSIKMREMVDHIV